MFLNLTMIGLGALELFVVWDQRYALTTSTNGLGILLALLTCVGLFSIYLGAEAIKEDLS
jgi:hypothetical protein